jgi:UDP-glucose 4-epimerase
MKALITGGAGFIGSHIAEKICSLGGTAVVLDNFSLGSEKNLDWARGSSKLEAIKGSIGDEALIKKIIEGCDWIFHHAALPSVPLSVEKPIESNNENLTSSLNLLMAARSARVKRFVFASSSAIYGDSSAPYKQENNPVNPLSPYALQKYATERYGQLFHSLYGLETVSLRYFNVFGPRQSFNSPYSGVIAKFCTHFIQDEQPVIFGDGLQSRDFIFIDNVVEANLRAAQRPKEFVAGKVFNVGGGESITLLDLISALQKITGKNLQPTFSPSRSGDIRASRANIETAKLELDFKISVSWLEGLRKTYEFYQAQRTGIQPDV